MIKVLFVCLGNICRSPMAEAMFRHLVKREGLEDKMVVDSAGTGNWHVGEPPHKGTREILKKYEINGEGLKARQITAADLHEFDYVIAMDRTNENDIKQLAKAHPKAYIGRLLDFSKNSQLKDVPDPYFTGNFEEVYELLKESCEMLLQYIKKENKLN
ncbi:low molecular weight phosphotyrosine protein phosphatase [Bacillus aquiflavi]|uniref:protein-tyrosine-phosphatase n=1 Tax=Bacillus aquiflavi TaxID=2672567 RepID=A0A6B3VVS4_9BACI|nr:low molecular weight protein-tyrosine-phosphatase [Bacillus aquiflavi]MBA4536745.1 low molecular weight phosphotyrosine protein phosphatase [Bacillus aquiflavi]NEY81112.1 low molecular weight phosphotyrosine protein phosphatase [Bacillus aquiflavi]UAC48776.1 low molecular weight phosphotyrosine protein phosphatase [Bacillus aquiflavi]